MIAQLGGLHLVTKAPLKVAEGGAVGFALPDIRRLLTKPVLRVTDVDVKHRGRLSHYKRRGYSLT